MVGAAQQGVGVEYDLAEDQTIAYAYFTAVHWAMSLTGPAMSRVFEGS